MCRRTPFMPGLVSGRYGPVKIPHLSPRLGRVAADDGVDGRDKPGQDAEDCAQPSNGIAVEQAERPPELDTLKLDFLAGLDPSLHAARIMRLDVAAACRLGSF